MPKPEPKPKTTTKMKIIYEPSGPAREYSPLAANLFRGCGCRCEYCYAPSVLRMSRQAFGRPDARSDVLKHLAADAKKLAAAGDPSARPVLLCFTCDPYQPLEFAPGVGGLTRRAIEILENRQIPVRILTKRPMSALMRDGLMLQYADVDFGVTLSFTDDADRQAAEPGAESVSDRAQALQFAHQWKLSTWLSLEPVIAPAQAIGVIQWTADWVDVFKVGKLNHDKARESEIDWREFLFQALRLLTDLGAKYYIKDDLWSHADREIRDTWPKRTDQHPTDEHPTPNAQVNGDGEKPQSAEQEA